MTSQILPGPKETIPRSGRWARWVRFLDQREPGTSLALFRIAMGLVVVGSVGSVVMHGLVPSVWMSRGDGGFLGQVQENWLVRLLGGASSGMVWTLTAVTLLSGMFLVLGLGGRITAFIALQAFLALTDLNPYSHGGDDYLICNALWLLVLARSSATLSLDCRLRTGRWISGALIPAWPRYLAIFQLVLVYWATGVQKISADWVPGGELSALYYICQLPTWVRWDMTWLAWVYPLTQAATLTVWLFEVFSPLLLLALYFRATAERPGKLRAFFNRVRYRGWFVAIGAAMHVGLIVVLNVEPFSSATLSFYVCLFRPEEWQALGRRLFGKREAPMPGPALAAVARAPWWPHARAALVTAHLVAILVVAFPAPPEAALKAETWELPAVRAELAAWSERLSFWGNGVAPEELQAFAMDVSRGWIGVYNALKAPFSPYYEYCGTYQTWCMFAGVEHDMTRLEIAVKEGDVWRTVAIERDPDHPWLDGWLSHHRLRPAIDRFAQGAPGLEVFAAWLGEQAALDFPNADRVRVRYLLRRIPPPEDMRAGNWDQGQFVRTVIVYLR